MTPSPEKDDIFDEIFRGKLSALPPPPTLKETILKRMPEHTQQLLWEPSLTPKASTTSFQKVKHWFQKLFKYPVLVSAFASILLILGALFFFDNPDTLMADKQDLPHFWEAALNQTDTEAELAYKSSDFEAIKAFLKKNAVPVPEALPTWLSHLPLKGCQAFQWAGKEVSMIQLGDTTNIQLFTVSIQNFPDDQPLETYISKQKGAYSLLAWSDTVCHYILIFPNNASELSERPLAKPVQGH